jgi:hypothetical protein
LNLSKSKRLIEIKKMKIIFLVFTLIVFGCRTAENGYSKTAVTRYDIEKIRDKCIKNTTPNDTMISLQLFYSGCIRGKENNLFIFRKINHTTQIDKLSNFRRFKSQELTDTSVKWNEITANIQQYMNDTIVQYFKVIKDEKTILYGEFDHGLMERLDICFGSVRHTAFLGPMVDTFNENENNLNLKLIKELTELVDKLSWVSFEKFKTKMMR